MRNLIKLSLLALVACSAAPSEVASSNEDDLTSATARARKLTFGAYVYVDEGASDADILSAVRAQTQSAFGALRTSQVGVASRELKGVSPASFVKTKVTVAGGKTKLKVAYTYRDDAIVPIAMATRSSITSAVMTPGYADQTARVLKECTANDSEANEFSGSLWYVFDPSLGSCHDAMGAEQKKIDADAAKLPKGQLPQSEIDRLYVPITVSLAPAKTYTGGTYPEYDRLYAGGVKPNRLVISLVNGLIDHESHASSYQDSAWSEWIDELSAAVQGRSFKLASIDSNEDLSTFSVEGKTVHLPHGFMDVITDTLPSDVGRDALLAAVADKVTYHWIRLEAPVRVKIGGGAEKAVTIEIMTYFGSGSDAGPHKYAIKNSDVFLYNGHSYIGYGPLDPSNFVASDFPSSYQILFVDGCVSYNYYDRGYWTLKPGGTKNLDMVVNGMEAPSWHSGYALGKFVHTLIDGTQASYLKLLQAASDTDQVGGSLRVVDGEVDNKYNPAKTPITVR